MQYPKRLIEVDLPIKEISAHARREKSIRHGHISTLHIWWARRPLAACRAVLCAALWPDPADELCPQSFRDAAAQAINDFAWKARGGTLNSSPRVLGQWLAYSQPDGRLDPANPEHWNPLRRALLDFIADFANWDNSTVPEYLETARTLTQAAHEALGGAPGTRPLVVDPFAGGGAIPLEALRVGADAFASDLNPVAVLLNKVVLEYIPKYGQRLADEVRKWGAWIKERAEQELAEFYPPHPDGATPIAYLWARTVLSEAPGSGELPVEIPLIRSMSLSQVPGNRHALRWKRGTNGEIETEVAEYVSNGTSIQVRRPLIEIFEPRDSSQVPDAPARGGAATCPVTGFTTPAARVKAQLSEKKGGANGARLIAVYVEKDGEREFRAPASADLVAFQRAHLAAEAVRNREPGAFPSEPINPVRPYANSRGLSAVTRIGCTQFSDLYNSRQLLSIRTFYLYLQEIDTFEGDSELLNAIKTLLAFAVDRLVYQNTSLSRWDSTRLTIKGAFSKQALAVVWDFAEANPFSNGSANWSSAIDWIVQFIENSTCIDLSGTVVRASATEQVLPVEAAAALATDPPYYAAIPYSDLSDFFYVWLRRGLGSVFPELFQTNLTEKLDELIVTNAQLGPGARQKDDSFFREGMTRAFSVARETTAPAGVAIIIYADSSTSSWEALLGAIIDAGWVITSSWPIDTEMLNRTQAQRAASLQSSIHIVCHPREDPSGNLIEDSIGDWRDVLAALPHRIKEWLPRLAREGVVGADAIFACLGPALEIFSRYARVEKASGEQVTLREYLEYVWAAVAREALNMIFEDANASGFEEDARLTAMWLWTLSTGANGNGRANGSRDESDDEDELEDAPTKGSGYSLEFDAARKIAQGIGAHLDKLPHLVQIKGSTARLLRVAERARYLLGKEPSAIPTSGRPQARQMALFEQDAAEQSAAEWGDEPEIRLGDTTLDRLHQAMLLFAAGRGEALRRFVVVEGVGRDARFWSLAQALSALYPSGSDEKRWVDGVLGRKKGFGF